MPRRRPPTWQNTARLIGATIVALELRQVWLQRPVDQGLLLLAAGLLGLASSFKRNGGNGGGSGPGSHG